MAKTGGDRAETAEAGGIGGVSTAAGCQDCDAGEPAKVRVVECEQVRDSVNNHRGHKPGIVREFTENRMRRDELLPG